MSGESKDLAFSTEEAGYIYFAQNFRAFPFTPGFIPGIERTPVIESTASAVYDKRFKPFLGVRCFKLPWLKPGVNGICYHTILYPGGGAMEFVILCNKPNYSAAGDR